MTVPQEGLSIFIADCFTIERLGMQIILGIIFHFIGGFASGSFYMPFKKVKGWHWESYWIIGGLFSWLIVPPIAAALTVPGFAAIIHYAAWATLKYTMLFGLL